MDYDTKLIMLVKQFPELYDNCHGNFKNKDVRRAIWADIAYKLRKECDEKSGERILVFTVKVCFLFTYTRRYLL